VHDEATNVFLTSGLPVSLSPGLGTVIQLAEYHGYPTDWYGLSVANPDGSLAGHRWSVLAGGTTPTPGSAYIQTVNPFDNELTVNAVSPGTLDAAIFGRNTIYALEGSLFVASIVSGGVVQVVGDVAVDLILYGAQESLRMILRENSPAYAWFDLMIPADAQYLAIDFMFEGMGDDDMLSLGIDGNLLFALDAGSVELGSGYSTGLLDVSMFSGQLVEFFAGFVSDDVSGGEITLSNFQFYSFGAAPIPEPGAIALLVFAFPVLARRRIASARY
jgi:hypothetical protein